MRSSSLILTAGAVTTLTPVTLTITDGCQGQAEAPVVRSRAFQLTAEEDRAAPYVVTNMYLLLISLIVLLFMLNMYMIV